MKNKRKSRDEGFSLIELLIAMAVVLILVGGLVVAGAKSIQSARETSALQSVQSFNSNAAVYQKGFGGFPSLAADMGGAGTGVAASCSADGELPQTLATDYDTTTFVQSGYNFQYKAGGTPFNGAACGGSGSGASTVNPSYEIIANPVDNTTKAFCGDQYGVFYLNPGSTMVSPPTGTGCLVDNAAAVPVGQ